MLVDRPSNESHAKITLEVKDYEKLVNDEQCNISFSKQLISEALDQLKIGKSCGYGGISNEFYIYGRSDQLTDILYLLYNSMLNLGLVPDKFNISVVIPIPKSKVSKRILLIIDRFLYQLL